MHCFRRYRTFRALRFEPAGRARVRVVFVRSAFGCSFVRLFRSDFDSTSNLVTVKLNSSRGDPKSTRATRQTDSLTHIMAALCKKHNINDAQYRDMKALIADSQMPPRTKLRKVNELGDEMQLRYVVTAPAEVFCTHVQNRGGALIDWYQGQDNLNSICTAGADLNLLVDATAFEIAPIGKSRDEVLDANRKLAANSLGALPDVHGMERYAMVATSHVQGTIKAAKAGCTSPFENMCTNGKLDPRKITDSDEVMATIFDKGYPVHVWRHVAEELFPELPGVLEAILNSTNAIAKPKNEIQCFTETVLRHRQGASLESIQQKLMACNCICKGYLGQITSVAKTIVDANETIDELLPLGTRFGETKKLGEEFWCALNKTKFWGGKNRAKVLLLGIAANYVSPKVKDGIAKMLLPSDFQGLGRQAHADHLDDVEDSFTEAKSAIGIVKKDNPKAAFATLGALDDALMRFGIHLVLMYIRKVEVEGSTVSLKSGTCKANFVDTVKGLDGLKFPSPWKPFGWERIEKPTKKGSKSATAVLQPVDGANDILTEMKVTVGSIVHSHFDPETNFYRVVQFNNEDVTLERVLKHATMPKQKLEVSVDAFHEQWKKVDGNGPQIVVMGSETKTAVGGFVTSERELKAFLTIQKFEKKNATVYSKLIAYSTNPHEVFAVQNVAAGALVFSPLTSIRSFVDPDPKMTSHLQKVVVDGSAMTARMHRPSATDKPGDSAYVPFWWCINVGFGGPCTPNLEVVAKCIDGVEFVTLENEIPIEAFVPLRFAYQKSAKATTLMVKSCKVTAQTPKATSAPPTNTAGGSNKRKRIISKAPDDDAEDID